MFPNTISEYPWDEAMELTTNSGADVPKATIVNPIAKSDTLYFFANEAAPVTNQLAPIINNTNPATTKNTSKIFCHFCL